ncbi:MAG: magnesium transporter, partial [Bacteroidia bacterium]|nr:magnesium transporter [Bacteroidia bacterium]
MKRVAEFELTTEYRDWFQQTLDDRDIDSIRKTLDEINAADITALLYEFNREESKFVLDLLPVKVRAEIINDLDSDDRKNFLKIYQPSELTEIINLLDSDD